MKEIRLIDANALKEALKSGCENCSDANTNWCEHCCKINDFEDLIDYAPTVEIGKCTLESDKAFICGYEKGKSERPKGEFNIEDFKRFVEGRIDMQDLYLPEHLFMLLDEYLDMRGDMNEQ